MWNRSELNGNRRTCEGVAMASIRKRTWTNAKGEQTAWIADYFDQAGKRHIKTFATKKAADAWLVTARSEVQQGIHTARSDSITVAEAGDMWIAQGETDGLERATLYQYRQHLDYHIKPFLGRLKLVELSPATVQDYRNKLIRDGRSRTMAKKAVGSLGAILANAMGAGQVGRNVVREQTRQSRRQSRLDKRHEKRIEVGVDIPTKDEIRAMLTVAQGWVRPLVVTAIFTGLRASELRGLRWSDVDLDRAELTVRQRADRWGTIGSPKSDAGKRSVPLAPMVVKGAWLVRRARRIWFSQPPGGGLGRSTRSTREAWSRWRRPPASPGRAARPNTACTACGMRQPRCSLSRAYRRSGCRH
jgi:integrase